MHKIPERYQPRTQKFNVERPALPVGDWIRLDGRSMRLETCMSTKAPQSFGRANRELPFLNRGSLMSY